MLGQTLRMPSGDNSSWSTWWTRRGTWKHFPALHEIGLVLAVRKTSNDKSLTGVRSGSVHSRPRCATETQSNAMSFNVVEELSTKRKTSGSRGFWVRRSPLWSFFACGSKKWSRLAVVRESRCDVKRRSAEQKK